MKTRLKAVIISTLTLMLCSILYPPWAPIRAYGLLFSGPITTRRRLVDYSIDWEILLLEWLAILILGVIAFFLVKMKAKR